jgi:hypothetical protein
MRADIGTGLLIDDASVVRIDCGFTASARASSAIVMVGAQIEEFAPGMGRSSDFGDALPSRSAILYRAVRGFEQTQRQTRPSGFSSTRLAPRRKALTNLVPG